MTAVFPDVEALVGGYLSTRAELAGVPVGPTLPTGHTGNQPAVVLIRDGGSYDQDEVLDHAQLRVETYGVDVSAAHQLMLQVRSLLFDLPTGSFTGAAVSAVSEETGLRGLRRLIDRADPAFTRYALNVRLFIRLK